MKRKAKGKKATLVLSELFEQAKNYYVGNGFDNFKATIDKIQTKQNKRNQKEVTTIMALLLSYVANASRDNTVIPIDDYLCALLDLEIAPDILLLSLQDIDNEKFDPQKLKEDEKAAAQTLLYKEVLKAATLPQTLEKLQKAIDKAGNQEKRNKAFQAMNNVFYGNTDDESALYYRVTMEGGGDCLLHALSVFLCLYYYSFQDTLESMNLKFDDYFAKLSENYDAFNRYKVWYEFQEQYGKLFRERVGQQGYLQIEDIKGLAELFQIRVRVFGCEDLTTRNSKGKTPDLYTKIDVNASKATLYLMFTTFQSTTSGKSSYRTGHWDLMIPSCFRGYFPDKMLNEGAPGLWNLKERILRGESGSSLGEVHRFGNGV